MTMRLLLINGNTTQAVTDIVVAEARRIAPAGTIVTGVSAAFGASIVTNEAEDAVAAMAVLERLAEHHADYDAAILAISFDSGIAAAKHLSPIPVIGMTEAAITAAARLALRIGIIVFGAASLPLYRAVFARHPEAASIAAVRVIDIASTAAYLDPAGRDGRILAEAEALHREGAGAVVLCGAAMAGTAARLQPGLSFPLLDGIACAVEAALANAATGVSRRAVDPLMASVRMTGLSPALTLLFAQAAKGGAP
jgi:allantoin racemase